MSAVLQPATAMQSHAPKGGVRALIAFFRDQRRRHAALVLATIIGTTGATYRKAGAQMLIRDDDHWQGLLSGGCLEGDLAAHAREVFATGTAKVVSYELSAMTDAVWGFGLGCDGSVRILLQRLDMAGAWEPFASLADAIEAGTAGRLVFVVESTHARIPVGSWSFSDGKQSIDHPSSRELHSGFTANCAVETDLVVENHDCRCFGMPIPRLPRLIVLGGGPDALPLVQFAAQLGWHVSLVDHRAAYADPARFPAADRVIHAPDQRLPADLDLSGAHAVVIMSHNLAADERYFAAAVASQAPYIGLLGPDARKRKLLASLPDPAAAGNRVRGPVGLDLGGEGPEAIALAIVAQIQAMLHGKNGVTA